MPLARTAPRPRPGRRIRRATLALLTAVATGACAHATQGTAPAGAHVAGGDSTASATTPVGPVRVLVENRSTYDVIIYAVRGTLRRRIGSVAGASRTTITLPETFTSDFGGVSIAAVRLAGNESYVSDSVVPHTGDRLVLTVQPRVVDSSLSVQ